MKKSSYIALLILGILIISAFSLEIIQPKTSKITLETTTQKFVAGTIIKLTFSSKEPTSNPLLVLNHSFGNTVVSSEKKEGKLSFIIPTVFSKKTGVIDWTLVENGKTLLKNSFEIVPNIKSKTIIEHYLGPRSIQAGNRDYSMLVVIPTDMFDNPLPQNTIVNVHEQYLQNITIHKEKTNHFIAWRNISSKEKSGNILVSSSCNNFNSNELTTVIYPSNAVNFNITYNRNHDFADGNQLTQLITSSIIDEFGNIVSDGTLVEFIITTAENTILKTRASTIKGIATAKILHPDYPTSWKIKAFITGLAESNFLSLTYKATTENFNISFSKNNREITVGPLQSFMKQLIPDGAVVKLHIYHKNNLIETKSETSFKGFVTFHLSEEFYKEATYSFEVEALGISKKIAPINYAK